MKDIYLILENKTVFKGKSFGAYKEAVGEVVFSTAMTGYIDTLTDPTNFGQLVIQTFPAIGNHGVIGAEEANSIGSVGGYIVKDWCQVPSNFRCEGDLDTFLKEKGIPGICGIDTRKLTKMVRESGTMNAKISFTDTFTEDISDYKLIDAVKTVSVTEPTTFPAENEAWKVVMWDFGANRNMINAFGNKGCSVTLVPFDTKAEEILALKPDGVVLSGGPGNPLELTGVIAEVKKLLDSGSVPVMGMGLGHQLMALAKGGVVEKLKYGHRGKSVPVKNIKTGKVYISEQNHSYHVAVDSVEAFGEAVYVNVNDGTCEGIDYKNIPAFSVQFAPESFAEPMNPAFLLNRFTQMMEGTENAVK